MGQRLDLHAILVGITPNVYFQAPASINMQYPCLRYNWDDEETEFANDRPYNRRRRYSVTVIDTNPDSLIPDQVAALPLCVFDRFYTADNLNHYVYKLFF